MTILKNEPLFPPEEGDYVKPRHIVVKGSNEEIGYDLAKIAKEDFNCEGLLPYVDPVYGEARREYFANHWPSMNERSKGARRFFGVAEDDNMYDASVLAYDLYDVSHGRGALDATFCSSLTLPKEKTEGGKRVFTARNWDMNTSPLWSGILGKPSPEGAFACGQRSVIVEVQPDKGYKHILIGCHELMSPLVDGINEKGLYFTMMADPAGVGEFCSPTGGDIINGLTSMQLGPMLMDTCATVQEAKKAILNNRIIQVAMCIHVLVVDAAGDAFVFEIDKATQAYVFVDRKPGEPLFSTNHPIHSYPTPDTYPPYTKEQEHNTFQRMNLLNEAYAKMSAPLRETDASKLIDVVQCNFVDCAKAQTVPDERTLINTTSELTEPHIRVRFFLKDLGPIEGTNHMKAKYSDWHTFGF